MDLGLVGRGLSAEREELVSSLAVLTKVTRDPSATIGFGKRVGEGTSEAIARMERVGQADALAAKLAEVERALAKIGDGTYGLCDVCGASIAPERLEAVPSAVRCIRCASARR